MRPMFSCVLYTKLSVSRQFVPIINKCAEQLVKNLQARVGEDVEIRKYVQHAALVLSTYILAFLGLKFSQ